MSDDSRPIDVGDYVRWENEQAGLWCEGSVAEVAGETFWITIDRKSPGWTPIAGRNGAFPFGAKRANTIRRIPRPAEAQATVPAPPAPALVDGLTPEECETRWSLNRARTEAGTPLYFDLTPDQIAVGAARWRQQYAECQGAQLRAKVAAGREAERCRVRVDPQDEP